MNSYVTNKLVSLGVVFSYIYITYLLFGYTELQWQAILVGILIFGYSHFFVGFYYQIKSFGRAANPRVHYYSFVILTAISILISFLLFKIFGFAFALFVGFLYFLFHGSLNEKTLILRQTSLDVPHSHMAALAVFFISLLVYSIPDKTFFFNSDLTFQNVNDFMVTYILNNFYFQITYFPIIFWFGIGLTFTILLYSWCKYKFTKITLFLACSFTLIILAATIYGAPAYIYMYFIIVGYHFVTWLIFYITEMKNRGSRELNKFLIINTGVFVSLILLAYFYFNSDKNVIGSFLFDYRLFTILTYVHISTSFMNDQWFKNIEQKLSSHFS